MKLITELNEDVEIISEASLEEGADGKKNMYIKGVFLQSAIKNRNGRIYPEEIMDREVGRYIKEQVTKNRAVGELNHPQGPQINPERISHKIVELTKDGTNWVGKAMLTSTPCGNIAKGLIESGVQLGVSSRGMGTLKMNKQGINEVQNDFKLATAADIVFDPSAPDAFVNGIMEGVEFWYDDTGVLHKQELAEQAKKSIEEAIRSRQLNEAKKLKAFMNYMESITKRI